ncbi:unnamed protein product [Caenorhabditis nigoni]
MLASCERKRHLGTGRQANEGEIRTLSYFFFEQPATNADFLHHQMLARHQCEIAQIEKNHQGEKKEMLSYSQCYKHAG